MWSGQSLTKQSLPDSEGKYKFAFIMVAQKRSDISDDAVQRLDIIRRYWDAAFDVITLGRRHSASEL
jgi:hypothetical protein